MAVEEDLQAAAGQSVRTVVIRPAIFLHGHGQSQFVPMLIHIARTTGIASYIGEGQNRIASVHVDDLAELYALAAEKAPSGSIYNGSGADVSTREIAEAIAAGQGAGVRAESISPDRAQDLWGGFPALLLGINNRVTSSRARDELAWDPYARTPTLVEDLVHGSYAAPARSDAAE
jgi:nucleoside-diphosphate-sugar epimerase